MTRTATAPYLLACLLAAAPAVVSAAGDDARNTIVLKADERAAFLQQMRTMLEGLQQILQGLGDENMDAVAQAARPLGTPLAEKIPRATMQRLPEEFRQLAESLHTDFQRIALDAQAVKDERQTAAQLSAALAKCLACHRAYQVRVE